MKNSPPKADVYNKETSLYYASLVKAHGKKKADIYWRRREYVLYDYEIFTTDDLKKIKKWANKFTYKDKWTLIYYNDSNSF